MELIGHANGVETTPIQRWVTRPDGVALSVQIHAAAPGAGSVPALLVHGFGSSATANWLKTGWVRVLSRQGITTATVDLRGHGRSSKPHEEQRYTPDIMVADVTAVLADLASTLGPVFDLVGYSMGSRLITEVAARLTADGDSSSADGAVTVRRLVIGGYDGRVPFAGDRVPALVTALEADAAATAATVAAGYQVAESTGQALLRAASDAPNSMARIAALALAEPGADPIALAALVRGIAATAGKAPAPPIQPTLVIAGSQDRLADRATSWLAGARQARVLEIPGRDHITTITSSVARSTAAEFLSG